MATQEEQKLYWAWIENGEIVEVIDGLVSRWKNILAMHHLTRDELSDLSWAGHEHTRWLPVRWDTPFYNEHTHTLEGPYFRILDQGLNSEVVAEFQIARIIDPTLDLYRGLSFTILGESSHELSARS